MKRNSLFLSVTLLVVMMVFFNACKKEKYAPTLTLYLEPYVVYYQNQRIVLYDDNFNKLDYDDEVLKLGQIQKYVDMKDEAHKIYSIDDAGNFVTAAKLNTYYRYPQYKATSFTDEEPEVSVTYDEKIGVSNSLGINLGTAGEFKFTYQATVDGEKTTRTVILRVYNSYKSMDGKYYSKAVKTSSIGTSNNWGTGFEFGERKPSDIKADAKVNLKLVLNKLLNNKKLRGSSIRGESDTLPTVCHVGTKKESGKKYIEIEVKGSAVERTKDDSFFDAYLYGKGKGNYAISSTCIAAKMALDFSTSAENTENLSPSEIFNEIYDQDTITLKTLVVITDLGNGKIDQLQLDGTNGQKIDAQFITINYGIKRYIYVPGFSGNNGHLDKNGRLWKPLDETDEFKNWSATFKEGFVKTVYYSGNNINVVNEAFDNSL